MTMYSVVTQASGGPETLHHIANPDWLDELLADAEPPPVPPPPAPILTQPEAFKVDRLSARQLLVAIEILTSYTRYTVGEDAFYRLKADGDPDQTIRFCERLAIL